ncbi:MAG: hypothetical protein QM496_05590 [Verrucomicrobiota bacterium]
MKFAATALACFILVGCGPMFDCDDTFVRTVDDPLKVRSVSIVIRDCGATTDYTTLVILHASSLAPDPDLDPRILVIKGKQSVVLTWEDSSHLTITTQIDSIFSRDVPEGFFLTVKDSEVGEN